jgi:diguanylate cyclase (GGDEF)-like protein
MKILVAEDDPVSSHLLKAMVSKWGYEVVVCRDGLEAWNVLDGPECPPLAILDWMMPEIDGVELCRRLRERNKEPYVYVLLLTAKARKEDLVEGIDAGADDYLVKPFNKEELRTRLRAGVRIVELQNQLIKARDELRFQATHDPLTGVWNRAAILDALDREIARAERESSNVGVILIDLDHFKLVNDLHGHAAGDAALREAVRRFGASIRVYDFVGRYGGEEFLVVAPGCGRGVLPTLAERLRTSLSSQPIQTPEVRFPLTCSLGLAASDQLQGLSSEALLRGADAALYRAKGAGRDRYEIAQFEDMLVSTPPN